MTVERVAGDGKSQSLGMGTVEPQLVGAPCMRYERDKGVSVMDRKDAEGCDCGLAVLIVHSLPWTVVQVRAERQSDNALGIALPFAIEQGQIAFACLAISKLQLQVTLGLRSLGDNKQA